LTAPTPTDLFVNLVSLCEQFRAAGGVDCQATIAKAHTRLDAEVGEVVQRAVREFLTNVRLHSRATRVVVTSTVARDGSVRFSVTDDGIGLGRPWREASRARSDAGIGLWSIEQRLQPFDGYLDIESSERGTRATVVLPRGLLKKE
jgi:signal transduction histidine kinase